MTEDIVEFGATAPKAKRAPRRGRPQWLDNRMLPVAALGAAAGAGSLMLPWQRMIFQTQGGTFQPEFMRDGYEAMLINLGVHGSGYLLALIGTVTAVTLLFYGQHVVPGLMRVIGAALSGINVVILAAIAYALSKGTAVNVPFIILDPQDREQVTLTLDWGFYAALAAVVALGVATLRAQPLARPADDEAGSASEDAAASPDPQDEADDGVIDLSVSVHPVGKQVAAG